VKSKLSTGILCVCLLHSTARIFAQEPPPQQPPPAQQPTAPGTPPTVKPTVQMPPTPPKPPVSKDRDTGGDALSIEALGWYTTSSPTIKPGHTVTVTDGGDLHFPGKSKYAEGVILSVPTTRENSLEFTIFQAKGQGNKVLTSTQNYFGNDFFVGDTLASNWRVRAMKLSWNYLTYPYPSNGAKFRVKTLWEVQYANIKTGYDAPLDVNTTPTTGTKAILLPTFGMGIEYHPAKRLRLELKGSGFGLPHRSVIWDAEGSAVLRLGKVEALAGARIYHYKTSAKKDEYFNQTLGGPYVGLRIVFR
jgi:hypothetical protein